MRMERIRTTILAVIIVACSLSIGSASGRTDTYTFVPDQSTVVQTNYFGDINETYTVTGGFQITVDFDAGNASFDWVDATLTESPNLYTQDLGELFFMSDLVGTVVNPTTIEFEFPPDDPNRSYRDIQLTLIFQNGSVHLSGDHVQLLLGGSHFSIDAVAIVPSKIIFVDVAATGANNGSSWVDAYNYLQDALADANSTDKPVEIRVAYGTYKPDQGSGITPGDRTATFQLINGVIIKGSYAGVGAPDFVGVDPNYRDFELYESILSGDLAGDDDMVPHWEKYDNSYHVVTGSGTNRTAILDGFTVIGGSTIWDGGSINEGGGMYNDGGSPTLANCTFSQNEAIMGAGMYNSNNSSPKVYRSTFNENWAVLGGGGMYNEDGSDPVLVGCSFRGNRANWRGGGIYHNSGSSLTLTKCTFLGNWVYDDEGSCGGAFYNRYSSATLTNCLFSGNWADVGIPIHGGGDGGAIFTQDSNTTLTNCTFSGNSAIQAGGIRGNYRSSIQLTNCILWGNSDESGSTESAQIQAGQGILVMSYTCIEGLTGNLGGSGNIGTNPLFIDADGEDNVVGTEDDNLRLSDGSLCINAGDNTAVPPTIATDLDGNPRIMQGTVDMGCYEFQLLFLLYVDAINGDDNNDGLSRETAFATIQKGIDSAENGYMVLVYPGVYAEEIDFKGKAITVRSGADAAAIVAPSGYAVSFYTGEGPNSLLKNFVIRNSFLGIFIAGASPTISNVTVVDCNVGIAAYAGAEPDISNSIFWYNIDDDLFQCQARYSYIQDDIEPNQIDPAGLVSRWKFDEGSGTTAHDLVGNNDGTIYGAQWTTGRIGNALDFNGVSDYVDLGIDTFSTLSKGTIGAWIKPATIIDCLTIVGAKQGTDTRDHLSFSILNGNLRFRLTPGSGICLLGALGETLLNPDTWYHVAYTTNNSGNALYVNGSPEQITYNWGGPGTNAFFSNLPSGQETSIGILKNYDGVNVNEFNGLIDEVVIFNRALSFEEVHQLYQNGLGGGPPQPPSPLFVDPANGDYHLLSARGRYRATTDEWLLDNVTSPCVDRGDPSIDPSSERMPNGGRINMGAYGGTAYASMSEWRIKGDINRDGVVNFIDFAIMAESWLTAADWAR